jgi:hypothetical protein
VVFGLWLILAGVGRNVIEFFRPDQPTFPGTAFSYSRFFAILMALAGLILVLIKMNVLKIKALPVGRSDYFIAPPLEEVVAERKAAKEAEKENKADGDDGSDESGPADDV